MQGQYKDVHIPALEKEDVVTCYAQQRPRRNGGYRLELQKIGEKTIVHNYGHGGAGVSLAPGCAIESVNIAKQVLKDEENVAVIGCGIIGIFTCLQLFKNHPNIKIDVYAASIPIFGEKDHKKLIASQVAPGLWFPFHYGRQNDSTNTRIASLSLKSYRSMSKQADLKQIVKEVDVYDLTDQKEMQEQYSSNLFPQISHTYGETIVRLNNKITITCKKFTAIKVDMQPFLSSLMNRLKTQNIEFHIKKIDENQLETLPHNIIFNCSGLGSRLLFNDTQIKGVKGHLVEYRNPDPSNYDCFITANIGNQIVDYYMHGSRILLGLTEQDIDDCKVEESQVKMLQKAHIAVLLKFGLAPYASNL